MTVTPDSLSVVRVALGSRSYEVRVHLQWRVVFLHDGKNLIAYDVMNHDEVSQWLKGQPK